MTFATPGPVDPKSRQYRYAKGEGATDPSGAGRITPSSDPAASGASEAEILGFGMKLFLASLTMVFMGCFVAYVIIWFRNRVGWESAVDTGELMGLAGATVLLVAADLASARALKRAPDRARAKRLTRLTIAFAVVYLGVQSLSWLPILARVDRRTGGDLRMEEVLFLMLTFAHAVHVLGGVIANGIVLGKADSDGGPRRNTLRMLYQYWRFLTVVWVGVLGLLIAL